MEEILAFIIGLFLIILFIATFITIFLINILTLVNRKILTDFLSEENLNLYTNFTEDGHMVPYNRKIGAIKRAVEKDADIKGRKFFLFLLKIIKPMFITLFASFLVFILAGTLLGIISSNTK